MKTVSDSVYRTCFLHKPDGETTACHWCWKTYVFRQPKNHQLGNFEGLCVLLTVTKFSGVPA